MVASPLAGLPELAVGGLPDGDARALLDAVLAAPVDARVREQIVAEARGNPLALLELPLRATRVDLAGGFGLPGALPLAGRIEDNFRRQIDVLPEQTQQLLLVAAADPTGDPALVWRARSTSCRRHGRTGYAGRPPSLPARSATPLRYCSRRPSGSSRSTSTWPTKPTWTPGRRRT